MIVELGPIPVRHSRGYPESVPPATRPIRPVSRLVPTAFLVIEIGDGEASKACQLVPRSRTAARSARIAGEAGPPTGHHRDRLATPTGSRSR